MRISDWSSDVCSSDLEAVGADNIFIFGLTAAEVAARRDAGHDAAACIAAEPRLAEVLVQIATGAFSPDDPHRYVGLVDSLHKNDWFMVTADFGAYWDAQRRVEAAWRDRDAWRRKIGRAHV